MGFKKLIPQVIHAIFPGKTNIISYILCVCKQYSIKTFYAKSIWITFFSTKNLKYLTQLCRYTEQASAGPFNNLQLSLEQQTCSAAINFLMKLLIKNGYLNLVQVYLNCMCKDWGRDAERQMNNSSRHQSLYDWNELIPLFPPNL